LTDTGLLAVVLAGIAGLLAGRAWSGALQRRDGAERPSFRTSTHYTQGLHYLSAGQIDLAVSELSKVIRDDPDAIEVLQVLGNLLRESGQVERAVQVHQGLLARSDLTRAEHTHARACLGMDFRKAGLLDRATQAFDEALVSDPKNIHALMGLEKLHEEQQQWGEAYEAQARLSRLRKTDDSLVLGYLQAEMGIEALAAGKREQAEQAFVRALSLDRRVVPAQLGLSDLCAPSDPRRAAQILEAAIDAAPERAYLCFDRLAALYAASGEPSRFGTLCERIIQQDPRDWRGRLALARQLRGEGKYVDALGLLLRALEANPQALLTHLEIWRTFIAMGVRHPEIERYLATAENTVFYADPHVCTVCRYRSDDMLWRCPHCHEWSTFVEERLGPAGRSS
jgi:lipopolysaccharide biosynthesis regulator YciM